MKALNLEMIENEKKNYTHLLFIMNSQSRHVLLDVQTNILSSEIQNILELGTR